MVPIRLEQVTKHFGPTVAVERIDLRIESGELFFLLGPSGCGKTTLLRMIAGLVEVTSGRIHLGERDVTRVPTGERNTAMVFQSYALWPHMTVRDNVAFGLDVRKVAAADKHQRVAAALARVHMDAFADRRPAQLSGGQQQRVALARALAVEPAVLLLDEPLSNLDAKLRLELRGEIRRICTETRITAVYVTHDQEEAISMADRVAVLHEGRLCQVGAPRELYDRPRSRFVADFLGQTNFIPATVAQRRGEELLLDSAAGRLRSRVFPAEVRDGQQVTCSVRLEAVRLLANGSGADNEICGRLIETVYHGYMAQHSFAAGEDLRLRLNELKPSPRPAADGEVRVGFDAEDVVTLVE